MVVWLLKIHFTLILKVPERMFYLRLYILFHFSCNSIPICFYLICQCFPHQIVIGTISLISHICYVCSVFFIILCILRYWFIFVTDQWIFIHNSLVLKHNASYLTFLDPYCYAYLAIAWYIMLIIWCCCNMGKPIKL